MISRQGDDLERYQILLACQKQFLETHVVLWTVLSSDMIIIITKALPQTIIQLIFSDGSKKHS